MLAIRIMKKLTPFKWFAILSVIAIVLALSLPPDPNELEQLQITETTYRLAVASLLVPYVVIWYFSFYAFAKLKDYAALIKGTKDGKAFKTIALGMGILSFSLVLPTIIYLVLNNIAVNNRAFESTSEIVNNYLGLFPGLIAFLVIFNGARILLRTTKDGTKKLDVRLLAPIYLLLSVVFTHLVIENFNDNNPYRLNLILLITTIIVPYLYGWLVGLLGAYDLWLYSLTAKGSIYQKGIKQFSLGTFIAILSSILIQFVDLTLSDRMNESLGLLILINFALLIMVALGLLLMAKGTNKLKMIEGV